MQEWNVKKMLDSKNTVNDWIVLSIHNLLT